MLARGGDGRQRGGGLAEEDPRQGPLRRPENSRLELKIVKNYFKREVR
jgi:hypothetical protein